MFNGDLIHFQSVHENSLLQACKSNKKLVLQAPTGSGKTVLVTKFIDDYLDENPNTVFIWLCPGAGNLQDQSRDVFEFFAPDIKTGGVYDFVSEYDPSGTVYFINWDKINKSTNVVLRDGEDKNIVEKIIECRTKNIDFFMVIDEEHLNKQAADLYERTFNPTHILRISATTTSRDGYLEVITDDEVIAAGLIASGISINENLTKEASLNDGYVDDLLLLKMADEKRKEIQAEYDKRNINIRPLVLIQFPNGSDEWIARVKSELKDLGYTEKSGLVTSWFSGEHPEEPEELDKLNGKYSFLLFKQAIATGWDCPRAKILVKLREGTTENFDIQTIGRIRRMPERHHYDCETLDHCYVYTLDEKFTDGLTTSVTDSFYLSKYLRKKNSPSITLKKEYLPESDRQAVDEEAVVKAVRYEFLKQCDVDGNNFLTRKELEDTKGFVFGIKLKTQAIEGFARTTNDLKKLEAVFCGEHEINIHDDGFIIRNAKRKIAQSVGIDENIMNKALQVLFDASILKMPFGAADNISLFAELDKELDLKYKLIRDMGHREFCAFLVNNWEIISEMIQDIDKAGIELCDTEIEESEWYIPKIQNYKKHKRTSTTTLLNKNVFEGYGTDILIQPNRSQPEIMFEQWCELNNNVKWIYKNGDKGQEFFSIVYRVTFRRYNFYPDYVIQLNNGDVWVIEVKGGADANGVSENRDNHAAEKLYALKNWGTANTNIKWGFVRNLGAQLFLSNTKWVEDLSNNSVWKPISDFIE